MDFLELLETYKANPRRESAVLVLQDPWLLRYCVCFRQVKVQRLQDWLDEEPSWEALWRCVHVDVDAIALLANDVPAEGRRQVERLKGLRLVYPDGTVMREVERLLEKRIAEALK